jgi:hypothetical protein
MVSMEKLLPLVRIPRVRKENLPTIRPRTHLHLNQPHVSLNYGKTKLLFKAIIYIPKPLIKNEFVSRTYDDGDIINSQPKEIEIHILPL